jgi:uncharacterized membrane protein
MNETNTTMPQAAPQAPRTGRGLKIALAVSVALNLGVAGLVTGIVLHGGPGGRGDMVRDLGFGPFEGALSEADRDALRGKVRAQFGDIRAARREMQADAQALLAALTADPFDPAALTEAMAAQAEHLGERLKFGSDLMRDHLLSLSDEDRRAFAGRLEDRMRHGRDEGRAGEAEGKD